MTVKKLIGNGSGWQLSVRPGYLLFAVFAVSLCLTLSFWQWQRAQDAEARYQQFLQQKDQAPLSWQGGEPASYQPIKASGQIQRLFLLDNQISGGVVGWHVLAELLTDYGPVLINLGWQSKQSQAPDIIDFASPIQISGLASYPENGLMLAPALEDPAWPGVMQQIDIPLLREQLGSPLAPFVIVTDSSHAGLQPVKAGPDNKTAMHIGYAMQWLLIGMACLLAFFFASRGDNDEP